MNRIVGIDLGTTNSCMAVLEGGAVQVIPNQEGGRTTPSVVAFSEKGERWVGQIARRQAITNYKDTVYAVKRLIGRKFDSPEVQQARPLLPFELTAAASGDVRIRVRNRVYSPPEISAFVLQKLCAAAEEYLGTSSLDAIVTVPAYFDEVQRQATKDAGQIAGLHVVRIINEPTAAALAYGLGKKPAERIAVFDLGGGTFDVSILELNDGVFEVLSTCGDSFLGGEDFDQCIVEWMVAQFQGETAVNLRTDRLALQRVKEAAEKAKCELSIASETHINLPFISTDTSGPKHFHKLLTRAEFEKMTLQLVERTVEPCQKALSDARLEPHQIDHVILVGGQTRMPLVRSRVESIFGKAPSLDINPDEVVAIGAAIQGGVLSGQIKDIVLLDVIPLSLGVETQGGFFTKFLDRNTTIPTRKSMIFTTVADNQSIVEIHVLQGEREIAAKNRSLGKFDLVGIAPAPRGLPQIDVTFEVDADGLLNVAAKDQNSGKEQAIRITPSSGLSQREILRMIEEANRNVASDRKRHEEVQLVSQLEGLLNNTRRSLEEFEIFLSPEDQQLIHDRISAARHAIEVRQTDGLRHSLAEVQEAAGRIQEAILSMSQKAEKKVAGKKGKEDGVRPEKEGEEIARKFLKSHLGKPD
ncbi:MAG: molecular chaperone DnaK [Acidobacteriia bacterium]|nr:molecular chaperone DnaK [Terriglobia bacterium]